MHAKTAIAIASASANDNVALFATISLKIDDQAQRTWTPILHTRSFATTLSICQSPAWTIVSFRPAFSTTRNPESTFLTGPS